MTERQLIAIMAAILCQATIADNDCDANTRVAVERAVELYGLVLEADVPSLAPFVEVPAASVR